MDNTKTPTLSIYIAARYSKRDELRKVAARLRSLGYDITSRWLDEGYSPNVTLGEVPMPEKATIALNDLKDIRSADVMLFYCEPENQQPPRGGRHVEFGIAHALGKYIVAIGEPENIFHYLPGVKNVPNIEAAIKVIQGQRVQWAAV